MSKLGLLILLLVLDHHRKNYKCFINENDFSHDAILRFILVMTLITLNLISNTGDTIWITSSITNGTYIIT